METVPFRTPESATPMFKTAAFRKLPFTFARQHGVFIEDGSEVKAYCKAGVALPILAEIQRFAGTSVALEKMDTATFEARLALAYQHDAGTAMRMVEDMSDTMDLESLAQTIEETEDLLEQQDDAPIIRLINALLMEAIRENASDIHIETFEKRLIVRFRIDGVLQKMVQPKRVLAPLLVSRIKVMAKLDIAEKRLPQDGRISLKLGGRDIDVRVSTMPSSNGERVVLRLLDKQVGVLDLSQLGLSVDNFRAFEAIIYSPHGIVLVTGPTGSGKTTTLYAALTRLNDDSRNILAIEDPIEYYLEGIGQTQVNTKVDMTFARGLRSMLRQDPDVVMVGEIRDVETARIAVQASLTGHLVLSTLHTNSAVGAITRLSDMQIEPFLLSSSLIGLIAQRLVRRLCETCKEPYTADAAECAFLEAVTAPIIYRATGCPACRGSGYRGRQALYEIITVDSAMRALIHGNAGEAALEAQARRQSLSIRQDGCQKVLHGQTTIEEVMRVTKE